MLFFREAPVVAVLGHGLFSVLSGFVLFVVTFFSPSFGDKWFLAPGPEEAVQFKMM